MKTVIALVISMAVFTGCSEETINFKQAPDGCVYIVATKGNSIAIAHVAGCVNPVHLPENQAILFKRMRNEDEKSKELSKPNLRNRHDGRLQPVSTWQIQNMPNVSKAKGVYNKTDMPLRSK